MALYNFGSISAQHIYSVDRFPTSNALVQADRFMAQLGGSGANQSVAAHRAGCPVHHIGMTGRHGAWLAETLASTGVNVDHIEHDQQAPSAHTMVFENSDETTHTIMFKGANGSLDPGRVLSLIETFAPSDILMLQNETHAQATVAAAAQEKGMTVVYTATPFCIAAVVEVLPYVALLALLQSDLEALAEALNTPISGLHVPQLLVLNLPTHSLTWVDLVNDQTLPIALPRLEIIDQGGALDACVGYFTAGLCLGEPVEARLAIAAAACALQASRKGEAEAIPDLIEIKTLMHSPV